MAGTDNPWITGNSDNQGQTPTWFEIIRRAVDAKSKDICVAMPCAVVTVKTPNRVDLQPLLMREFKSSPAPLPLPIIQDALVGTPRGSAWMIKCPIAPGDLGLAIFGDRSLDVWASSAGPAPVDPVDKRAHDMSDAIFYPGLYPFTNPPINPLAGPLDLVLQNGAAQLLLQPGGTFMQGNGPLELFQLLVTQATTLNTMATAAAAGFTAQASASTGPLAPLAPGFTALAAVFTATVAALTPIVASLTALQGAPEE